MSKVLVVGPSWVGDMVMAQSLFKTLKKSNADSAITVLAPAWSMPILARMPEVSDSVEMPLGHGVLGLATRRRIGHKLRRYSFDRAIVLPGSLKSALIPWFAKIPLRTGYRGEQRWGLLNDIRVLDKSAMPMNVQRFVALGVAKSSSSSAQVMKKFPRPQLVVKRARAVQIAAGFARHGVAVDERKDAAAIVALCPGAEYGAAKQWPAEYFAEVANHQIQLGQQVWLFGSQNDRQICARINRLSNQRCADLSGRTSLGEVIDLMSLATHVVTNDSGLMHIAAAINCHVIALYGSSSDVFTPPLTDKCNRLTLNLECSPCFQRECPLGHLNCLNQLHPALVLAALKAK